MFQNTQLVPLSRDEAEVLLVQCSVDEMDTQRVASFSQGHPLALKLAVVGIVEYPDLNLKEVESQRVVSELAQLYLSAVVILSGVSMLRRSGYTMCGICVRAGCAKIFSHTFDFRFAQLQGLVRLCSFLDWFLCETRTRS
jgi:hypothetical protein